MDIKRPVITEAQVASALASLRSAGLPAELPASQAELERLLSAMPRSQATNVAAVRGFITSNGFDAVSNAVRNYGATLGLSVGGNAPTRATTSSQAAGSMGGSRFALQRRTQSDGTTSPAEYAGIVKSQLDTLAGLAEEIKGAIRDNDVAQQQVRTSIGIAATAAANRLVEAAATNPSAKALLQQLGGAASVSAADSKAYAALQQPRYRAAYDRLVQVRYGTDAYENAGVLGFFARRGDNADLADLIQGTGLRRWDDIVALVDRASAGQTSGESVAAYLANQDLTSIQKSLESALAQSTSALQDIMGQRAQLKYLQQIRTQKLERQLEQVTSERTALATTGSQVTRQQSTVNEAPAQVTQRLQQRETAIRRNVEATQQAQTRIRNAPFRTTTTTNNYYNYNNNYNSGMSFWEEMFWWNYFFQPSQIIVQSPDIYCSPVGYANQGAYLDPNAYFAAPPVVIQDAQAQPAALADSSPYYDQYLAERAPLEAQMAEEQRTWDANNRNLDAAAAAAPDNNVRETDSREVS